jgi:hypothetical protein
MTITYPNGQVIDGILCSKNTGSIRVAAKGCDDAVEFTVENGIWWTEDLEPVLVEFAWERYVVNDAVSEDDCICPKDLASRLIQLLSYDSEEHHPETSPKVRSVGASYC